MQVAYALFADAPWNWVNVGLGGVIRTNISRIELEASARALGLTMTPATFGDIRVMEEEAMRHWAHKRR